MKEMLKDEMKANETIEQKVLMGKTTYIRVNVHGNCQM